jgi:hypothetical protein
VNTEVCLLLLEELIVLQTFTSISLGGNALLRLELRRHINGKSLDPPSSQLSRSNLSVLLASKRGLTAP